MTFERVDTYHLHKMAVAAAGPLYCEPYIKKAIDRVGQWLFYFRRSVNLLEQHRVTHCEDTLVLFGAGDDWAVNLLIGVVGILSIEVIEYTIGVVSGA